MAKATLILENGDRISCGSAEKQALLDAIKKECPMEIVESSVKLLYSSDELMQRLASELNSVLEEIAEKMESAR